MNIAHLIWALGVGGTEEMLVDIVNQQCRTERVTMIVVNGPADPSVCARIDPAVNVVYLNRTPGSRGLGAILRLNWIIARIRPDIVHAHSPTMIKLLLHRPYRTVLTVHGTRDAEPRDSSMMRFDQIAAVSKSVAADIDHRGASRPPVVILNGIPCSSIRYRTEYGNGSMFRIVKVARLDHGQKGQDVLIRAVAALFESEPRSNVHVDLIGDGPSRPYLEGLVAELGLERAVTFRGRVPRRTVLNELCEYDLLVQASMTEGFGLVAAEAMAAGVPALVSDLDGLREVVKSGRFGFLFRPGDGDDCARQIRRIVGLTQTGAIKAMAIEAREHALKEFDISRTSRQYLEAYGELLSRKVRDIHGRTKEQASPMSSSQTRATSKCR